MMSKKYYDNMRKVGRVNNLEEKKRKNKLKKIKKNKKKKKKKMRKKSSDCFRKQQIAQTHLTFPNICHLQSYEMQKTPHLLTR